MIIYINSGNEIKIRVGKLWEFMRMGMITDLRIEFDFFGLNLRFAVLASQFFGA